MMRKWSKRIPVLLITLLLAVAMLLSGCSGNEAHAGEVNSAKVDISIADAAVAAETEAVEAEIAETETVEAEIAAEAEAETDIEAAEAEDAAVEAEIAAEAEAGAEEAEAEADIEAAGAEAEEVYSEIDFSTIPEGIFIGDVDVGGMTAEQARAAIRDYVEAIAEQPVILAANDEAIKTTVTEIGFVEDAEATIQEALSYGQSGNLLKRYKQLKDLEKEDKVLPLALTADEDQVKTFLEEHVSELNRDAVDWGLTRESGEFVITEGQAGQEVDIDEAVGLIMTSFSSGWQENSTINLPAEEIEPKGSEEELSLVQDVLGKFSTDYSSSSSARKTNIMVGAGYIDGTVIYPGETFSVEAAVTPFDEEHGYELAGSYESGATVDTYGGGICQVSTTLYNAVIRAELDIVERYGHSMMVSYVAPSDDAAIAQGDKDLKFTNNTDAPIYISAYTDGSTISFTVYGHETRPANRSVSFESETLETTEPTTEYRASSAAFGTIEQVQSAHTGTKAQLWKIVTVDGVEESREVFNTTTYSMYPAIYEVGVSSKSDSAVSAMYDAIASQSLDRIYSTIAAYSGSGSSSSSSSSSSSGSSSESSESSSGSSSESSSESSSDSSYESSSSSDSDSGSSDSGSSESSSSGEEDEGGGGSEEYSGDESDGE